MKTGRKLPRSFIKICIGISWNVLTCKHPFFSQFYCLYMFCFLEECAQIHKFLRCWPWKQALFMFIQWRPDPACICPGFDLFCRLCFLEQFYGVNTYMSQCKTKPTLRLGWPDDQQIFISACTSAQSAPSLLIVCAFYSLGAIQRHKLESLPYWVDVQADRPPSDPLWKYRFLYRFFLLKI